MSCSIEGCVGAVKAKGLCSSHYYRLREYGTPLAGGTARGKPLEQLFRAVAEATPNECWIWTHAKTRGYGSVRYQGRNQLAHRVVCEIANGPPADPSLDAAHNCGRGGDGCINPHHLRWATKIENSADTLLHGTRARGSKHGQAKICESDVPIIRRERAAGLTCRELAKRFGVSANAIRLIITGENWGWVGQHEPSHNNGDYR